MTKKPTQRHPLAERHFRQIVCRPRSFRSRMFRVWAVTWRPGDGTGSFLGKLFRPLGSPLMMVQASYTRDDGREGIGLFGIGARVDPSDATVSYDDLRLKHDFHRVPFIGARGPTLDPRDDCDGRGNGSWLRLGLEVDRIRWRAAVGNYRLPTAPQLPKVFFGYGRKEAAKFEVTPALRRLATAKMDYSCTAESLSDLDRLNDGVAAARTNAFEVLSHETQHQLLVQVWEGAFISPMHPGNSTGLWLLPHELSTDVFSAVRMFECFEDLVGAPLFNPARTLGGRSVPNPAIQLARDAGINLEEDLRLIAQTSEGSSEFSEIEQRLIGLVPAFRMRLSASEAITDQALLCALCDYEQPVAIEPALCSLSAVEQLKAMRVSLKPHLSECCTDQDLFAAVQNPNGPLFASGLCRVQALLRNLRVPVARALDFAPDILRRERMQATLWHETWLGGADQRMPVSSAA